MDFLLVTIEDCFVLQDKFPSLLDDAASPWPFVVFFLSISLSSILSLLDDDDIALGLAYADSPAENILNCLLNGGTPCVLDNALPTNLLTDLDFLDVDVLD